jgi:hypothetical protein
MEKTILNKLKEEHRGIQILLLRVERCKEGGKRTQVFEELKNVLLPHMEGEEQTLYAHLKNDVQVEKALEVAEEASFEHQSIKDLLAMLDKTDIRSAEWSELFSELKENLQLHFDEEEGQLFDEAKEDFSREELVQYSADYEEVKSHSHPY